MIGVPGVQGPHAKAGQSWSVLHETGSFADLEDSPDDTAFRCGNAACGNEGFCAHTGAT